MRPKLSSKEKDFFLVQRALCGDQEAYSAIFKKYRIILTIQISDIVNDSDLTADIVMETFEKAFQRLKNFQPDYQLSAWLVRIGRNCAIDYCRKKNRVNIVSIDEGFDDTEDDRPTLQVIDDSRTPEESLSFNQRIDMWRASCRRCRRHQDGLFRCGSSMISPTKKWLMNWGTLFNRLRTLCIERSETSLN